jgi:hypothetical protein
MIVIYERYNVKMCILEIYMVMSCVITKCKCTDL